MSDRSTRSSLVTKHLHVLEAGHVFGGEAPETVIARIGKDICFEAEGLNWFDVKGWGAPHYDLLVLVAAIEFADRRWKRRQGGWSRSFKLTVPVTDPKLWNRPRVGSLLTSTLRFLTGDLWSFCFVQSSNQSSIGARQYPLPFEEAPDFVIAYSEGLDSLAVAALAMGKALRIRVASGYQRRNAGDGPFARIPFRVEGHDCRESSFRSRGFQFAAVAAIAAHLSNVNRIVVPESGQGALGPSVVYPHKVHPDYRNHPEFFRKMEELVRAVLPHEVRFEQPRLWKTKGQTLRDFLALGGEAQQHLRDTRSCWQRRWVVNDGGRKQCGLCAACLLRRLSMHAAGIHEKLDTYVISDLSQTTVSGALSVLADEDNRKLMADYGLAGISHFQRLADLASMPEGKLRPHAFGIAQATGRSYEETIENLRSMLRQHAEEWQAFLSTQGESSFLYSWIFGGRDG